MSLQSATVGHVYFMQWKGGGPVKIGWAIDPRRRLSALQVASPIELMLLDFTIGSEADEAAAHRACDPFRIRGEWFDPSREMRQALRDWSGKKRFLESMKLPSSRHYAQICDACRDGFADSSVSAPGLYVQAFEVIENLHRRFHAVRSLPKPEQLDAQGESL